jgi:hypothetical protein
MIVSEALVLLQQTAANLAERETEEIDSAHALTILSFQMMSFVTSWHGMHFSMAGLS